MGRRRGSKGMEAEYAESGARVGGTFLDLPLDLL
jgi:hypothetical protein